MISRVSVFYVFFSLCGLAMTLMLVHSRILIGNDTYYASFGDQLSYERINEIIDVGEKWNWVVYPLIPLLYLTKCSLVAICLSAGAFLFRFELKFKTIFRVVLTSEFILLFPPIIKIFWFSFINVNYTLSDLQFFTPLSVINFFDRTSLEPWLVYPLSLINLFEVFYIITLSYLLAKILESSFAKSLKLVVLSYGTGLFIWVLFITFLSVSLSA